MANNNPQFAPLFSQVDVTTTPAPHSLLAAGTDQTELLREVLAAQDRTNELLEELVGVITAQHKQRAQELSQWKSANPNLAKNCRRAADVLSRVQVEYLERITEDINDSSDDLEFGDFLLNEFIDRYGPRLAHLNGVIQVLAQLSSTSTAK